MFRSSPHDRLVSRRQPDAFTLPSDRPHDSGFRSITVAVQVDLSSGLSATTVQDVSQP